MLLKTPQVDIGWQAPQFSLPDPDGNVHSIDELMGSNGLVVAFICNHCPYVKAIVDRLATDADALKQEGIGFVGINSNDFEYVTDDAPPRMKEFAAQHGFGFPYLVDEDQSTASAFDAVCTPDFFGFDGEGKLRYRGRLDDAKMGDASDRKLELVEAMQLIASTGQGPDQQFASMGCSIKWKS